ncbi:hypothetical protein [Sinomonas notoginsengisoli]|uniref:hypothetical protein n=1 Tax=Sinomonas notoginsengisoli TaxID=1457311 RepID=UPI001F3666A9|nr:hypothetical protein [Sinomonas notoginsengisoli]
MQVTTGGDYVDRDGYTAHVEVVLYKPVALTAADTPSKLDICPGGPGGSVPQDSTNSFTSKVSSLKVKTAGGIAQAFELKLTSPDAKFPFPLGKYLAQASESVFASYPSMLFTGYGQGKANIACTVSSGPNSASWIGFATILPSAQLTPKNPDGKLTNQPSKLTLTLHEPLSDLGTGWSSPWSKQPHTDYGPSQGGPGNAGWMFEESAQPFSSLFVQSTQ